jgi:hypothetical protein
MIKEASFPFAKPFFMPIKGTESIYTGNTKHRNRDINAHYSLQIEDKQSKHSKKLIISA